MTRLSSFLGHRQTLLLLFLLMSSQVLAFQTSPAVTRIPGRFQTSSKQSKFSLQNRGLLQHADENLERESRLLGRCSSKWRSFRQACSKRSRQKTSKQVSQQRRNSKVNVVGSSSSRQRILSMMGVMLATLVARPVQVLAMGGGMGPKGPVKAMSQ